MKMSEFLAATGGKRQAVCGFLLLPCLLLAQYVEDSIDVGGFPVGRMCHNSNADVVYGCVDKRNGILFAIDCSTNEVTHSIPVGGAHGVAYDSTDNKVYCLWGGGGDSVLVFDGTTLARIASVPLDYTMHPVWDPIANRLYVAEHEDRRVVVIDCVADTVIKRTRTSTGPMRMHVNNRHRKLYVQCYDSERLNIVDLNSLEVIENIRLPGIPEAGCCSEAVDKYYCGGGQEVVVVDGVTNTVVKHIPVTGRPLSMVSVVPHARVFVGTTYGGADSVYVVDAITDSIVARHGGLDDPYAMVWSVTTDLVYCASCRNNQVTVIAGNGSRMLEVLRVGERPYCFAAAPRHRRLYVGHLNCGMVYVIRDTVTAIAEAPEPERAVLVPGATIVRDVLWMGDGRRKTVDRADLLDITGRKVMDLEPGENDVRQIPAGVYFARRNAVGGKRPAVTKVLTTR